MRDVEIFRPYPDEMPWELLFEADADEEAVREYAEPDRVRIARLAGSTVAAYVISVVEPTVFSIRSLIVARPYRGAGLGRWMLGHAIGISESKGGREIVAPACARTRLFEHSGFVSESAGGWRLVLTPE
jgi:GNAT superfamily N-acetyltransferase